VLARRVCSERETHGRCKCEAVCWHGVFAQSVKLTADVSVRLCAGMACLLRA